MILAALGALLGSHAATAGAATRRRAVAGGWL